MKKKKNRLKGLIRKHYKKGIIFLDRYNEMTGENIKSNTFYTTVRRNNENNHTYQQFLQFIYSDLGRSDADLIVLNKLIEPYDLNKEFKLSFQFPADKFDLFVEMMRSQQFFLEKAMRYEEMEKDKIVVSKAFDIDTQKISLIFEDLVNKLGIHLNWSSNNEMKKKEDTLSNNTLFVYLLAYLKLEYISLKFSTKSIKVHIKQEGMPPSVIEMPFKEFNKPLSTKVRDIQSVFDKYLNTSCLK